MVISSTDVQGETRAAQLQQQVDRQHADLDRLQDDLAQARSSGQQSSSRVSALEKQLHDKSAALVSTLRRCLPKGCHGRHWAWTSSPAVSSLHKLECDTPQAGMDVDACFLCDSSVLFGDSDCHVTRQAFVP